MCVFFGVRVVRDLKLKVSCCESKLKTLNPKGVHVQLKRLISVQGPGSQDILLKGSWHYTLVYTYIYIYIEREKERERERGTCIYLYRV